MRFEFATAARIIFGAGTFAQAGSLAAEMGRRALVVHGHNADRAAPLLAQLAEKGLAAVTFAVAGEPTTHLVRQGLRMAKEERCEIVLGIGGGSVLDAAKAIAALLTNEGELEDYLEIIGRGAALTQPSTPYIAIPTTAGTGTEVTRNAVLASPEHRVKVSLRSPLMLPRVALVDPELTYALPAAVTAATGLDALTQLIEPFVCARANPLTDALCREGMARTARSLRRAFTHPDDTTAREDMSVASLFGGLALANAGLGAVHGFAGPIGGMFPAPHGAVCGQLLPHVMAANVQAVRHSGGDSERFTEAGRILTGNPEATAEDGVEWVRGLVASLGIPSLSTYGIRPEDLPVLAEKAAVASSMRANPVTFTAAQLRTILAGAL